MFVHRSRYLKKNYYLLSPKCRYVVQCTYLDSVMHLYEMIRERILITTDTVGSYLRPVQQP
jgi:tRNA A58 N-methylase Trm61